MVCGQARGSKICGLNSLDTLHDVSSYHKYYCTRVRVGPNALSLDSTKKPGVWYAYQDSRTSDLPKRDLAMILSGVFYL